MATNAAEENETQEEEDILSVSEQLATDLANVEADEVAENEEETSEEETTDATGELSEGSDEEDDPEEKEEDSEEESKEDGEETEEEQLVETNDEQAQESETTSTEDKVEGQEDSPPDVDADPTRNLSEEMEALKAENATLTEKVGKLSKALHNMLVERVVDAKISRGLAEAESRNDLIVEHSTRTASSLADTLKDISALAPKAQSSVPKVEEKTASIGNEDNVVTEGSEGAEESQEVDPRAFLESHLYKQLNGEFANSRS